MVNKAIKKEVHWKVEEDRRKEEERTKLSEAIEGFSLKAFSNKRLNEDKDAENADDPNYISVAETHKSEKVFV